MKKTIVFNPFTRVEGDLLIEVEISNGVVTEARTSGTLYRGFENILRGRTPSDAIVITCRICGTCGGTHAAAASAALADAYGVIAPPNGLLARNVILGVETLLSHLSHFYFSFCTDFATIPRSKGEEEAEACKRFTSLEGTSYRAAVKARSRLTAILGLFAGKWPNTLALQPGGTTRPVSRGDVIRALGVLFEFQEFLQEQLLGDTLSSWLENRSYEQLRQWLGRGGHADSDIGLFFRLADKYGFEKLGRGVDRFLCCRNQPIESNVPGQPHYYNGEVSPCDLEQITEHIRYSWYPDQPGGRRPIEGMSEPAPEKEGAYSWCKAPRYKGETAEVGPLARLVIGGDPLVTDAFNRFGSVVLTRMLARLHEIILLALQIEMWMGKINPEEPFYVKETPKEAAWGCGLVEAPRGMLGHWIQIEKGRIRNYQVVTPTAWNLSPRDDRGVPGPLEKALVGVHVEDTDHPLSLAHTVRSYDPCLFCTVH